MHRDQAAYDKLAFWEAISLLFFYMYGNTQGCITEEGMWWDIFLGVGDGGFALAKVNGGGFIW